MVPLILLAAGTSRRMGSINKLLLPVNSETMIQKVVSVYQSSPVYEILVVIGFMWKCIVKELRTKPVTFVYNPHFETGMTSSIHTGLRHLRNRNQPFMLATADTPNITSEHVGNMIDFYFQKNNKDLILRSGSPEAPTHPTIFPAKFIDILLQSNEKDGCKTLISAYQQDIEYYGASQVALQDIDTVEEYNSFIHGQR